MKFYRVIKGIFGAVVRWSFRVHVHGAENEILSGGALIAANHLSLADPVAIIVSFRRQIHFLGKRELFRIPLVSQFLRGMGVFAVDRGHGDVGAVKTTISLLKSGECVGVFPQGTRCPQKDIEQTSFRAGIGMMAVRAGVPVQPVYIKAKNKKIRFLTRIDVYIGEKITVVPDESLPPQEQYRRVAETVKEQIMAIRDRVE